MSIRRVLSAALVLGLSAFIATGCTKSIPENAICLVGGDSVLKKDYDRMIDTVRNNYKNQGQKFPKKDSAEFKQLRNQSVDYLIEQALFKQQAEELGVKVKQKNVDARLTQLKESFFKGDDKAYKAELKKQHLTEADVVKNIRQQLLSEKLFEKVTKGVRVDDEKAKKYYEENPAQYKKPESREVAHILVKDKALANKIYAQVKGGDKAVFDKLAKKHSEDPSSKDQGGVLTVSRGQTVPEFDKEAFDLKTGDVSKPVKTQFGYHVITARGDVSPERTQKFDEVKAQIKSTLEQEQRSKRMQDWRTDLRKDAEEDVRCRKGYVWTQTVTATTETAPPPAEPPATTGEDKGKDEKGKDADKDADKGSGDGDGKDEAGGDSGSKGKDD